MTKKILALLSEKFKGERKDGLTMIARSLALQASTDEEAESLVDKLSPESVKGFIKEYRSEVDRETSEAVKRQTAKAQPKPKGTEDNEPTPTGGGEEEEDPKAMEILIAKAVQAQLKPLQDRLNAYELQDLSQKRLSQVKEAVKDCKDELFSKKAVRDFGRMSFADEEAFGEFMQDLKTDVEEANKLFNESSLSQFGRVPLPAGGQGGEPSKEVLADVLKQLG